jgi:lysophospholipase L1-like esterase
VTLLRRLISLLLLTALSVPFARARADDPPRFEWKDGDRVVLVGDTLIERDQKYGYLETLITLQNPDKTITFRNLGWSGDTPYGVARAGFGTQVDGFRHLKEHVLALRPTVILVGYGMTDSFDGLAGLPRFRQGMNGLLDVLAETGSRLVLLSPIAHEDLGPPLPEAALHNADLRLYRDAIRDLARERQGRFIDLFEFFELWSESHHRQQPADGPPYLTDDGIHPNEKGYWAFAQAINLRLGDDPVRGAVFGPGGKLLASENTTIAGLDVSPRGLRFEMTGRYLPAPVLPEGGTAAGKIGLSPLRLKFDDLPDGSHVLSIDGRTVATADATNWAKTFVTISPGPEDDQVEQLRRTINEKNRLYFYRWRPQNETYLFGFRKHEQGNNAREIPLFDPLVEEKEREIARLRVPVSHVYELVRESKEPN